ncbi:hypothetical protein MSP8887_02644 [Marinomonas spartinae]|uniref:DUF2635 domain-containing protein n=1 Tax=Marinomonas spartinae TaxID=1792290 RepID=UPI000808FFAA|nr:DUF2635 domain-containing protein [Marinomonas spartinae]SBS36596.1 hypothetical protein MSP8887_02644 [Marinomonas spartinae]
MQAKAAVTVRPAKGGQVRKENGQIIPKDGIDVVLTSYYRRRISDGDLIAIQSLGDK